MISNNNTITLDRSAVYIDEFKFLTLGGETWGLSLGEQVSITVSHVVTGAQVSFQTRVDVNGHFSLIHMDLSTLLDGNLLIQAAAVVNGVEVLSEPLACEMDADVSSLALEWVFHPETGWVDIIGTAADVLAGTDVELLLTDSQGQVYAAAATVNADGSFMLNDLDLSFLAPGVVTVGARATDNNGGDLSQEIHAVLVDTSGSVNLSLTVMPGDVQGITISGQLDGLPEGTKVYISISDDDANQQNLTAIVQANGGFQVKNIDTSVYTQHHLNIAATAGQGRYSVSASTEYELPDAMAMLLLKNALLGEDLLLDVSGISRGFDAGTTVVISINDGQGHHKHVNTLVQVDGSFSLTGIDLPDMKEGILHVNALAYKNNKLTESENTWDVELVRNHAPDGADKVIAAQEDQAYAITSTDLGFTDSDQHSLTGVKITALPLKGTFTLNGVAVLLNQWISKAALDGGQLQFQGTKDNNGTHYASVQFAVQDSGATHNEDLTPNTLTFNVTAVNDAPVVAQQMEDQAAAFNVPFSFTVPADSFSDVDSSVLTCGATLADGSSLPGWLSFNVSTRTFSGTPPSSADLSVKVTASDGALSVSDVFVLNVAAGVRNAAVTSAVGVQNNFLNAGDLLTVTANFSEAVTVTGKPQLNLNVGGALVRADYVSGSGTNQLSFSYKILAGQTDSNGVSLDANALGFNGGKITDAAGQPVSLVTAAEADNVSFMVDTTAPVKGTMTLSDTGVSASDGFSKSGLVTVGTESGSTWVYSVDNGAHWVAGVGKTFTLAEGRYAAGSVQMRETDLAGNVQTTSLMSTNGLAISVDNVAPVLVGSNPGDNGYLMDVAGNLTLNFNEVVTKGSGAIQIFNAANTLVESFDVSTSSRITGWGTQKLTIDPTSKWLASSGYYIQVASTAVNDLAGNAYAGINDATTLNFTTADAGGVITPTSSGSSLSKVRLGATLSGIGDFNGDGFDDMLIGDPGDYSSYGTLDSGSFYVVYGNANGTVPSLTRGTIAANLGFKVTGGVCSGLGSSLSGAGDINGDGYMDILVGTRGLYESATGAFSAYVLYGSSASQSVYGSGFDLNNGNFASSLGFKIAYPGSGSNFGIGGVFGRNVSQLGDVNGDGLTDWVVSQYTDNGISVGSYVLYGKTGGANYFLSSGSVAPGEGFFIVGNTGKQYGFGASVSGAGDVNGDGLADMVIANDTNNAFVVYGNSQGRKVDLAAATIAGSLGFKIVGQAYSETGTSVSSAGDVNGDGLADLIVGANTSGTAGTWGSKGTAFVVYGNSTGTTVDLSSGSIAASQGFAIFASANSTNLGTSVSSAGDVNGDGLGDLMVSASGSNSVYVVYGNATGTSMTVGAGLAPSQGFVVKGPVGTAVSTAGDINGDGLMDLLVGPAKGTVGYSVILGGTQWVTTAVNGIGEVEGTADSEALIGSTGDDTLTGGGGVDRFFAGKGNDTIVLTASDVRNLANNASGQTSKSSVNGGTGFDTVQLTEGANLDLTAISNAAVMSAEEISRMDNIDRIDLATDAAANTLKLHTRDVNDIAGMNVFHTGTASADGKVWTNVTGTALNNTTPMHQLLVVGDSNDRVSLNASKGTWRNAGTVSNGVDPYTVYENSDTDSQVLVKAGVTVQSDGAPVLISSNPSDTGYLMALGNNVTLTFDQAVYQGTGTVQLWNGSTGAFVESFDVASSNRVTGWSGTTLTIDPTADLAPDTLYFLKISDAAVQNAAGNTFTGVNDGTTMDFTTVNAQGAIVVRTPTATLPKYLGSDVAGIGDVNGDGFDDIVIGAYAETTPGFYTPEGAAYVVYGNASGTVPSLAKGSIAANLGFKITGGHSSSLGTSVSGFGDINADGYADILVGANTNGSANTGYAAYVIYGGSAMGDKYLGLGIDPSDGFKVTASYHLGQSVSGAGDVNGDGLADILVTQYKPDGSGALAGSAYVVYGNSTGTGYDLGSDAVASGKGFKISGASVMSLGYSASGAGDFNGDGLADVIVSARTYGTQNQGAAYVVYGNSTGTAVNLNVSSGIAASQGFRISGQTGTNLGDAVSSAGDVNGDGLADVMVGSKTAGSGGSVYVLYGTRTGTGLDMDLNVTGGTIAASRGFRISDAQAASNLGARLASAGDVNGDGLSDMIVSGPNGSNSNAYIVYGNDSGTGVVIDSNGQIAATQGFRLVGSVGMGAAAASDINGDGLADLVVGSNPAANDYRFGVILGGNQWVSSVVDGIGTVNGTSASEALIGSSGADTLTGGGGVDRFFAGMGNDTVVLTGSDVANLSVNGAGGPKATVSGGNGFDTIRLIGGANLDLTAISNAGAMGLEENSRIESIERIDLATDTSANILTLAAKDVKDIAGFNAIHTGTASADGNVWINVTGTALSATSKYHQLVVDGGVNDRLVLPADAGFWTATGTVNNGTSHYTVYQNAGTDAQVLVQAGVQVSNNDSVAPVVLDLNRDAQLSYGHVTMDVNGDGHLDNTAWAAAQDGVLVWDKLGDGLVHDNSQYAFSQYGAAGSTDLQGLAAAFDSNHDSVFNAQDAKFGQFKVWQDLNQNGASDAGEVRSLADWGITSLKLTSDGVQRTPADGVTEAGRTIATATYGSSVLVADAAFNYSTLSYSLNGTQLNVQSTGMSLDLSGLKVNGSVTTDAVLASQGQHSTLIQLKDLLQGGQALNGYAGDHALVNFSEGPHAVDMMSGTEQHCPVYTAGHGVAVLLLIDPQMTSPMI